MMKNNEKIVISDEVARRFFEAWAEIAGEMFGAKVTVTNVRRREEGEENAGMMIVRGA